MKRQLKFEIVTLDWENDSYKAAPETPGIYQIYGTSPIYGLNTLLYIGQANNLRERLHQHFDNKEGTIGRQPNKTCRFARLQQDAEDILTVVEETLIIMHKPSFNSARLLQVCSKVRTRPIYVQNHGERGILSMETTNFYFLNGDLLTEING